MVIVLPNTQSSYLATELQKSSVKKFVHMQDGECTMLSEQLDGTKQTQTCYHQQSTLWHISERAHMSGSNRQSLGGSHNAVSTRGCSSMCAPLTGCSRWLFMHWQGVSPALRPKGGWSERSRGQRLKASIRAAHSTSRRGRAGSRRAGGGHGAAD